MTGYRLAFVTERYWPLVSGEESAIGNLVGALAGRDVASTIITAQWDKTWPRRMHYGPSTVLRLPRTGRHGWSRIRYLRAVSRWLRSHQEQFDLVMVTGMRHEAHAAISGLARSAVPIVLRVTCSGAMGECQWQQTDRAGSRVARSCRSASGFIVPHQCAAAELMHAGYDPGRIHQIPPGILLPPARSDQQRRAARRTLSSAHELLALPPHAPLVVFADLLHESMGVYTLLEAWEQVLGPWPEARLWLVGQGPHGRALWDRIRQLDLERNVILPGSFDDLRDVLYAADVFVMPSQVGVTSIVLLDAMAAGVPIVASDTRQHRCLLAPEENGLFAPPRDSDALARRILEILEHPQQAAQRAEAARKRTETEYSLERCVDLYAQLFDQLHQTK